MQFVQFFGFLYFFSRDDDARQVSFEKILQTKKTYFFVSPTSGFKVRIDGGCVGGVLHMVRHFVRVGQEKNVLHAHATRAGFAMLEVGLARHSELFLLGSWDFVGVMSRVLRGNQ